MDINTTAAVLQKLIDLKYSMDETREYLATDLSEDPETWIKKDQDTETYLDDRFGKKKDPSRGSI